MAEIFIFSISAGCWAMWQFALKPTPPSPWWWTWGARFVAIGAIPAGLTVGLWGNQLNPLGWLIGLPVLLWTVGAGVYGLLAFGGMWGGGSRQGGASWQRGAAILTTPELIRFVNKRHGKPSEHNIELGGVPVPPQVETTHFLLAGGTGAGKSQALTSMMISSAWRRQRAIVTDPGGDFTRRLFKEGDLIFNPFDQRGFSWSPLAEMRQAFDAGKIAGSIIPEGVGEGVEWNGYARNILTAVLDHAFSDPTGNNRELVRLLFTADHESMAELVAGTPAARMYAKGNEKMLGSVLGIISRYTAPLRWLNPGAGREAFSVRSWVEQDAQSWLFLPFRDDQLAELRPLLAAIIDIAASATLSLPPDSTRRVWFFLDEFATLGRINSVEPLLTKARKNGGAVVLGIQSLSQLRETYGRDRAQTLLSCLSSVLILRQPDAESAEYMSRYIGEEEVVRTNQSGGKSSGGTTENWSEQTLRQRAVMAPELLNLPDRRGILNLAGDIPAAWVDLPIISLPDRAPALVEKQAVVAINPARAQQAAQPEPELRRDDPQPPRGDTDYDLP